MYKKASKLSITKETLRDLAPVQLKRMAGGMTGEATSLTDCAACISLPTATCIRQ